MIDKVKTVQFDESYMTKDGREMYKFWVEMENGEKGYFYTLDGKQEKIKAGEQLDYEYTAGSGDQHGKIKPTYKGSGGFTGNAAKGKDPKVQALIVRQNAMDRALTLAIHNSGGLTITVDEVAIYMEQIYNHITKNGELT
jgi:hypothetical protein